MYTKLKKEEAEKNCIKKVLPGVEFSVTYKDNDNMDKMVHVVTLFNGKIST